MNGSVIPPNEPIGSGPLEVWARKMVQYVKSLELKGVYNGFVERSTAGTFVRAQPGGGGGGGPVTYEGEHALTKSYKVGNIVRVSSIPRSAPAPSAQVQLPIPNQSTGVFICVKATTANLAACIPQCPEPVEEELTYWHLFALGVHEVNTGDDNGNSRQLINSSEPYPQLPIVYAPRQ